ncbi:MAG TPA: hypothetical protein VFR18_19325 [Terriglobia bacterium]|nr:hypothetical protein [Terriglobia bacterium]
MRTLEVAAAIVVVAGLVLMLAYPREASAFVGRILNSVRWINHDVPSHF